MHGGATHEDEGRSLRSLLEETDWSKTSLGPVDEWPAELRAVVRAALHSPTPVALWCGTDLNLIYNDAYREILGARHPGALGSPGLQVWEEISDEVAPMLERVFSRGESVRREDAPFTLRRTPEEASTADRGEPNAWFTFSLSPVLDEAGNVVAALNIVRETTKTLVAEREREEARARARRGEARLREAFTHAPSFMAILRGPDLVFEYVNEAYQELVGPRELIGRPVFDALPDATGQGFEEIVDRVVETGEPFVGREMPIQLASDPGSPPEERYLDFVYYPLTEPDGTVSGLVAHGSDVTDHVRARKELERARAVAVDANQAKSRFLATMSHELRTPLNAILGYTQLLEMEIPGPLSEGQRIQLERVRSSGRHLLMLIDDILDLTRVEADQLEVERRPLEMAETVSEALSLVLPQARSAGIEISLSCPDAGGPDYVGDQNRTRQVLVNLLSNAVKFTGEGGAVHITCGVSEPPRHVHDEDERDDGGASAGAPQTMTFVRVRDTGVGIEPGQMEQIFRPFTQLHDRAVRPHGGTGLGLPISRKLAELMGGRITAVSEVGRGSTFTLWMPR